LQSGNEITFVLLSESNESKEDNGYQAISTEVEKYFNPKVRNKIYVIFFLRFFSSNSITISQSFS